MVKIHDNGEDSSHSNTYTTPFAIECCKTAENTGLTLYCFIIT